jgi:E3 ubiquitin-protein ligase BRE1
LKLLAEQTVPYQPGSGDKAFPTYTSFKDVEELESHLAVKTAKIKAITESLFERLAGGRSQVEPDISALEAQVNKLLAAQKEFLVKIDRLSSEKEGVSEQLNAATLRYMKAERRMDRLKSNQVQKLEQQALASATVRPGSGGPEPENGSPESNGNSAELQLKLKEVSAVKEKQKEQLDAAMAQAKTLQEELTTVRTKLATPTDEDYSRSETFKLFKARQEELVKKLNALEGKHKKMEEENKQLNSERAVYKKKLENDFEQLSTDLGDQLQQADTNVVRIRATRDELLHENQKHQAAKEQERTAIEEMKALVKANEDRINALELEIQRLTPSEDVDMTGSADVESLPVEELREKYVKLQKDFESINNELPAMTAAVKRYQVLANKKVADFTALEERLAVTMAEKGKANQRYFDTRRNLDCLSDEVKKVRSSNNKSAEIITQLKESDSEKQTIIGGLEKQLAELRQANASAVAESKRVEANNAEIMRRYEGLKYQIAELSNLAKSKDATTASARERTIILEAENEKLKVRLESVSKDRDKWKTKSLSNSSEEEEMLRVSSPYPM